jgi:hypothetical protein
MNLSRNLPTFIAITGVFICAGVLLAQTAPKVLLINGEPSDVEVIQIDGHWYIPVEALVEITNGTVTIEAKRIVLYTPSTGAVTNAPAYAPPEGLSRAFASAAVATLAEMREWRGAIETMITYGLAVSSSWGQSYHDQAQVSLMQLTMAATTDSDRDTLQLLRNAFDMQSSWNGSVLAARQAFDGAQTVNPNTLRDDPVLAKLRDCSNFLDSMLVTGNFSDNARCH